MELTRLGDRLAKIGIDIQLMGNYPWVYLWKINGVLVTEKYAADHGFTIAMHVGDAIKLTDISIIFKLIRKYCKQK